MSERNPIESFPSEFAPEVFERQQVVTEAAEIVAALFGDAIDG